MKTSVLLSKVIKFLCKLFLELLKRDQIKYIYAKKNLQRQFVSINLENHFLKWPFRDVNAVSDVKAVSRRL